MRTYYKRRPTYRKKTYNKKRKYGTDLRKRARKNLVNTIKDVINHDAEKKIFAESFAAVVSNASILGGSNLTDIETGTTSYNRIGNEVFGSRFEISLNLTNGTNNDLFVRVSLLEEAGRGGTVTIATDTGIYQNPLGQVTSFDGATLATPAGPVMWHYDTQGSIIALKDKVFKLPKNNGGSDGATKSFKWNVPWEKKIRFINETDQGQYNQSRRVTLTFAAWSPSGGTQSTYTYTVDGYARLYYKDM